MSIVEALKKAQIAPDLIPSLPETVAAATVTFKTWTLDAKNVGVTAAAKDCHVFSPPTVSWEAKDDQLYTLVKIDPDAPSKTDRKWGPWLHYLVVNIPGTDIKKGTVLTQFVGVGAPKDTGLHRYVYLVYQQKKKLDTEHEKVLRNQGGGGGGRAQFPFVKTFLPKLDGAPLVAANFYEAEHDKSVDALYALLAPPKTVMEAFTKAQVAPDLLPALPESIGVATVTFKTFTLDEKKAGAVVDAKDTGILQAPTVTWEAKEDALYTVVKIDPDAPSYTDRKWGPWLHYLVVNIPGTDIKKGTVLAEYVGVGAPADTGLHRYIWLVYQQTKAMETKDETVLKNAGSGGNGRGGFPFVKTFLPKIEGATLVAGNLYLSQYDASVAKLYASLAPVKKEETPKTE